MRRLGAAAAIAVIAAILVSAISAPAAVRVVVPGGTPVLLKFLTPVSSDTIKAGTTVRFQVAANVLVGRRVVFRAGAPGQGVVTDVSKPGIFGKNAVVHIGYIQATAVDGRPVRLSPLDVTPNNVRQVKDTGAAAGSSVVGAILLGPVGLAAGVLIHGGHVSLPAGAVGKAAVAETARVTAP